MFCFGLSLYACLCLCFSSILNCTFKFALLCPSKTSSVNAEHAQKNKQIICVADPELPTDKMIQSFNLGSSYEVCWNHKGSFNNVTAVLIPGEESTSHTREVKCTNSTPSTVKCTWENLDPLVDYQSVNITVRLERCKESSSPLEICLRNPRCSTFENFTCSKTKNIKLPPHVYLPSKYNCCYLFFPNAPILGPQQSVQTLLSNPIV
jgi:hypothetical protein